MAYKTFDIVVVPFPFTDISSSKRRPAIILSSPSTFNVGHSVMAMVTSARNEPWLLDIPIKDLKKAGLSNPSVIRMKFFTLDHRLIIKKVGTLSKDDQLATKASVTKLLQEVLRDD